MRPKDFLNLAIELIKAYPVPASFRTSVSRAYYAAHHHIKEFVESAGVVLSAGPTAHADVWVHLSNIGDRDLEEVGNDLSALRGDRNEADYQLSKPRLNKGEPASLLVARAADLIARVDQYRMDIKRYERVKAAIRKRHRALDGGVGK